MTKFVNPYSFIPFGKAPNREDPSLAAQDSAALKTGWMDVAVTVRTPLIIPGQVLSDQNGHVTKDFFRLPNGTYAIPGSTLRGMIRSVYEAASNSCLPFVLDAEEIITSRTPVYAAFKQRGLLEYNPVSGEWSLFEANVYKLQDPITRYRVNSVLANGEYSFNGKKYQNAQTVHFIPDGYEASLSDGEENPSGWLQFQKPPAISDRPTRKGNIPAYHVCVLTKKNLLFVWKGKDGKRNRQPYLDLKAELEYTISNPSGNDKANKEDKAHKALMKALEDAAKKGGVLPVWYLEINTGSEKEYYLSPAAIGRIHQRRDWREIMGEYAPCTDPKSLCPACRLFGTASNMQGGKLKVKGRLRFGDALPRHEFTTEEAHLRILSNPKPSAFEFYLERPEVRGQEVTYWNFDYFSTGRNQNMAYHALRRAMPRGRKMYWHSEKQYSLRNPGSNEFGNSKLNSSFKAAPGGSEFMFRLYFDRITEKQLKELQWVITLGDAPSDVRHLHKLGHGRPLGYGSVKLSILNVAERSVTAEGEALQYIPPVPRPTGEDWKPECPWDASSDPILSLLAMTDVEKTKGKIVSYPLWDDGKIFTWFGKNRTNRIVTLPKPTDASIELDSPATQPQFDKDPEVPENQRLRPSDPRSVPVARPQGRPQSQPQQASVNQSSLQSTDIKQRSLSGEQDAEVTGFNASGSAYLRISRTGEKGFLPRNNDQGWSGILHRGQIIRIRILSFDAEHQSYRVIMQN